MDRRLLLAGLALLALLALVLLRTEPGRARADARGAAEAGEDAPAAQIALELENARPSVETPSAEPAADARAPLAESDAAHAILGSVVDTAGAPLAGASVTLFDGPLHGPAVRRAAEPLRTTTTDAAGRFRFPVPARDALLAVRASAPGFATESRNQSPDVDVPLALARVARVTGRVRGEDAAAARILAPAAAPQAGWTRLDDGAGGYALADVAVGTSLSLRVEPAGCVPFEETVAVTTPGEHVHDVELGARRSVAGVVIDSLTRHAIGGARLASDAETLAVTDSSGRFQLALQGAPALALEADVAGASDVYLRVAAEGFLQSSVALRVIARGAPVELVPGGRIEGRVLARDGTPAAGARVRWVFPLYVTDRRLGSLRPAAGADETRVDAQGRFALGGVPWGVRGAELAVEHDGAEHRVLDAAPDDSRTPRVLEIRMPRGRSLQGRATWSGFLFDSDPALSTVVGAPMIAPPRVTVRASTAHGAEVARTETDARGLFTFDELPAGDLRLEADGHPESLRTVAAGAAGEAGSVRLQLQPPFRAFGARLRSSAGTPLVRHGVKVSFAHDRAGLESSFGARTDENGAVTLHVPDLVEIVPVLVTEHGTVRLERALVEPHFEWSVPELVRVELVLGADPELPRLVAWSGPAPGESGRTQRIERPVAGVIALELPAGELELELTCVEPEPRRVTRKSVHVAGGLAEPVRISLAE